MGHLHSRSEYAILIQYVIIDIRYIFCGGRGRTVWATEEEEEMNNLTSSEVAGFGVGALLLCATISAPKIDSFISASQRR